MSNHLCITASFLTNRYHGHEWPPSPARLFQSLLAGAQTGAYREKWNTSEPALRALESLPAPEIVASDAPNPKHYKISVPNNDTELIAAELVKGRASKAAELTAELRSEKKIAPWLLGENSVDQHHLYYLWQIGSNCIEIESVKLLASFLHTLGRGVDMAYANSFVLDDGGKLAITKKEGYSHYVPAKTGELRNTAVHGYLDDLCDAHKRYCNRLSAKGPDAGIRAANYGQSRYKRIGDGQHPSARFLLRNLNNSDLWFAVPWALGMRVAAWVRHATAEALREEGYSSEEIDTYILGHGEQGHRRHVSFVPIPTIRTMHGDGAIRRVMVVEPSDSDSGTTRLLQWKLAPRVLHKLIESDTQQRKTEPVCSLAEPQYGDPVWPYYLPNEKKRVWHSVTPVILHGHNSEHGKFSLKKTDQLLYEAFESSGYSRDSIAELSFQSAPFWQGTEGALTIRVPEHLKKWPRYHIAVQFRQATFGPLLVGIGRHYGIGLFAAPSQ